MMNKLHPHLQLFAFSKVKVNVVEIDHRGGNNMVIVNANHQITKYKKLV